MLMKRLLDLSLSLLSVSPSQDFKQQMMIPRLYSAWFCPYAQRAWAALNELGVDFELVEALGSGFDAGYTKHPGLLQHNPEGLVPTLVFPDKKEVQCQSIDILKQLYLDHGSELVGQDRKEEVLSNLHAEATLWNQQICSPFYRVLMKPDENERGKAWNDMVEGLVAFSERLKWKPHENKGKECISFYEYSGKPGDDLPSMVDFTVFPFVHRLYIIQHYKGFCLDDTEGVSPDVQNKMKAWQTKMEALPSVRKTLADKEKLIDVYRRYSDGTAQSKVGDAVRQGKEAHDI